MSIRYVTSGELTIDYTVLESGTTLQPSCGGGAVYSAIGARLWQHEVGLHAGVGRDYPEDFYRQLEAAGLSTTGLAKADENTLSLWMLHENENLKQQIPRLSSGTLPKLDAARPPLPDRYLGARGFHLAPSLPETQSRVKDEVRARVPTALITADIWIESFFDPSFYLRSEFLSGLTALLPSRKEVSQLWGLPPDVLLRQLGAAGLPYGVVKLDEEGSLVYDGRNGDIYQVPIVKTTVLDTTGAGDAYCGGFLAGLGETGDPVEAALHGTVSASFVVSEYGALPCLHANPADAQSRLDDLRKRVTRLQPTRRVQL